MISIRGSAWGAAPALALAAWALPAGSEEARELKIRHAVGERRLVTVETTVDAVMKVTDLEENETPLSYSTVRKDSFIEEIVHLDDAQVPDQIRVNCRSSTLERPSAGRTNEGGDKTPLHGRIFTVNREGDALTATAVGGGSVPPDATAALGRWHDLRFLLRDSPVAVGAAWDARAADRVCALVAAGKTSAPRVQCTLTNIAKGTPDLAEIAVNITMDGAKEGDERRVRGTLVGNLVLDATEGKPVSLTLHGSLDASQDFLDPQGNRLGKVDVQAKKIEYKITFEAVQ